MKKILSSLLSVLILLCLFSCSQKSYRDDVSCTELTQRLIDEADIEGGYEAYTKENIDLLLDISDLYNDFSVIYSIDANDINEIGVFHSEGKKQAEELFKAVEKYVTDMQKNQIAFISSYAPHEVPKLKKATVKKYGHYVIYAIADDKTQEDFFDEVKDILAK